MAQPTQNHLTDCAFEFSFAENDSVVPFVVFDIPAGHKLYSNSRWALKVERVLVDGKEVLPERKTMFYDDPDLRSVAPSEFCFIYKVLLGHLVFASNNMAGGQDFHYFGLPSNCREIRIEYRVRFVDGSVSKLFSVTGKSKP